MKKKPDDLDDIEIPDEAPHDPYLESLLAQLDDYPAEPVSKAHWGKDF